MATNTRVMDSLVANEFEIELNGASTEGIFGVRGFVSYACDESGNRLKPTFEVSKMVQRDPGTPFNTWLRETLAARDTTERPVRELVIVAVDDGVVTRRWQVHKAWIQQVHYSEFDRASFEMVAEIFVIAYDDITEVFPAG